MRDIKTKPLYTFQGHQPLTFLPEGKEEEMWCEEPQVLVKDSAGVESGTSSIESLENNPYYPEYM